MRKRVVEPGPIGKNVTSPESRQPLADHNPLPGVPNSLKTPLRSNACEPEGGFEPLVDPSQVSWKQFSAAPPASGKINNLSPPSQPNFPSWADRQRAGRQGDGREGDWFILELRREGGHLSGQSKPRYLGDTR